MKRNIKEQPKIEAGDICTLLVKFGNQKHYRKLAAFVIITQVVPESHISYRTQDAWCESGLSDTSVQWPKGERLFIPIITLDKAQKSNCLKIQNTLFRRKGAHRWKLPKDIR